MSGWCRCLFSFFPTNPIVGAQARALFVVNDSVITHFKYSISKTKQEYFEPLFSGLKNSSEFKYIIEDENTKTIKAFCSLTTNDNVNYILDITQSSGYDCSFDDILDFTIKQISKRQKDFNLYIKLKKYTTTAEKLEKYLLENQAKCIQEKAAPEIEAYIYSPYIHLMSIQILSQNKGIDNKTRSNVINKSASLHNKEEMNTAKI